MNLLVILMTHMISGLTCFLILNDLFYCEIEKARVDDGSLFLSSFS